jgi:AICAR transformylase/IMP cyclohydrolase PurH
MIRGAAKNMAHVTVAVDPADYPEILDKLGKVGGWEGARHQVSVQAQQPWLNFNCIECTG